MSGISFVNSSPSTRSAAFPPRQARHKFATCSINPRYRTLAQRLVEAAKRAGADAADAVAVRGVSQGVEVRDGRVEESERSEGDDVGSARAGRAAPGCGVDQRRFRRCGISPNSPSARWRWPAWRRTTNMSASPIRRCWRATSPISICSTEGSDHRRTRAPRLRSRSCWRLAVKGVSKSGGASASSGIGGMVLVTSTGFHGSYLRSSHGISMTAISGDGTGMERDYDFTSAPHASDLASPESRRPQGRRAHRGALQSAQGRDLQGAGGVRPAGRRARWSAISSAPSTAPRSRARPVSSRTASASSCSPGTSASSTTPCACAACARRPSTPKASG